jgi:hypothetical protein
MDLFAAGTTRATYQVYCSSAPACAQPQSTVKCCKCTISKPSLVISTKQASNSNGCTHALLFVFLKVLRTSAKTKFKKKMHDLVVACKTVELPFMYTMRRLAPAYDCNAHKSWPLQLVRLLHHLSPRTKQYVLPPAQLRRSFSTCVHNFNNTSWRCSSS